MIAASHTHLEVRMTNATIVGRDDLDGDRLLSSREAAAYTPYDARTLTNMRSAGRGPAFIKMRNGAVAYRLRDLLAWQAEHRVTTLDQK